MKTPFSTPSSLGRMVYPLRRQEKACFMDHLVILPHTCGSSIVVESFWTLAAKPDGFSALKQKNLFSSPNLRIAEMNTYLEWETLPSISTQVSQTTMFPRIVLRFLWYLKSGMAWKHASFKHRSVEKATLPIF